MDNTYIIMNEHLYETMVDNIAINQLLILFTMTCTLTMLCCSKRDKKIQQPQIVEAYTVENRV